MANAESKRSTRNGNGEPGSSRGGPSRYIRQVKDLLPLFVQLPIDQEIDPSLPVPQLDTRGTAQAAIRETAAQICRAIQAPGALAEDAWIRLAQRRSRLQETLATVAALNVIEQVLRLYHTQSEMRELELILETEPQEGESVEEQWLVETSRSIEATIRTALTNNPAEPAATYRSLLKHLTGRALLNQHDTGSVPANRPDDERLQATFARYLGDTTSLGHDIERFLYLQASVLAQVYMDALNQSFDSVSLHLQPTPQDPAPVPPARENYLTVMSSLPYQAIREALALNRFQRSDDTPYPVAFLNKGSTQGHIQLRPPAMDGDHAMLAPGEVEMLIERMWQQQKELSDIDADALDALGAIWLSQARTASDDAIAHIDDLLQMRGLKPKKSGQGRRGGYEPEQRGAMQRALAHIQNLWLNIAEVEVYDSGPGKRRGKPSIQTIQSRAFTITDRMGQMRMDGTLDMQTFIFRPGKVFAHFLAGPGRQTALLSAKALHYDLNNQRWEKRLTRYVSWQWRVRAHNASYTQPYRVETLLDAVGETVDKRDPARTRNRLEKALDRLQSDTVIATWQYDRWDEEIASQRGWAQKWLQATILIEPPDVIRKQYQSLERHETAQRAALPEQSSTDPVRALGKQVERYRQRHGLSQSQAAEQLGVTQGYLSKLEAGYAKPTKALRERIQSWLAQDQ